MANTLNAQNAEMELRREQLFRELKYSEKARKRHEKHWKDVMLQITVPHVKEFVVNYWRSFERIVDSKDFEISFLMDNLQQQEEQYMKNERSHIQKIDALIVLCYDQIEELYRTSKLIRYKIYKDVTFESGDLIAVAKEREDFLKLMQYTLKTKNQVCLAQMRCEYFSTREVEFSKQEDMLQQFQATMEYNKQKQIANTIKFLEKFNEEFDRKNVFTAAKTNGAKKTAVLEELQNVLENKEELHVVSTLKFLERYTEKFDQRKNACAKLLALEDSSRGLIAKQWASIKRKSETITKLKRKLKRLHNIQGPQQAELKLECKYFEKVFRMQQRQCKKEAENDEALLLFLITESTDTLKDLEALCKLGQQLLTYVGICRKYETEEEKIVPFPTFTGADNWDKIKSIQSEIPPAQERKRQDFPDLYNFWLRVAEAEASRYSMQEKLYLLRKENKHLKDLVFQYCHCVKCPKLGID